MAVDVVAPKLGLTVTELEVIEWHRQVGDTVAEGDLLLTVSADKADVEIEAPAAGVLSEQLVPVGEVAVAGDLLGRIGGSTGDTGSAAAPAAAAPSTPAPEAPPAAASVSGAWPAAPPAAAGGPARGSGERVFASPLARRLARELGIEVDGLVGTGPGGRIVRADVLAAKPAASSGPAVRSAPARTSDDGLEELPFSPIRKVTARRMAAASSTTAPASITLACDMTTALATQRSARVAGVRATITHVVLHAVAHALARHPALNGFYVDERHLVSREVNLGVAVDVDGDLLVPVVSGAQAMSLTALVDATAAAIDRARAGALTPADTSSGTFTVSNLGMFGIETFVPIINAPQVAILGVGSVVDELAVVNGEAVVRPTMRLSLTFDHRVIDGAAAARFLSDLRSTLES